MTPLPLLLVFCSFLPIGLSAINITGSASAPTGSAIVISSTQQDFGGNTRIRYVTDATRTISYDEIINKNFYQRDRDLGQTFTVGANGFFLDAITLRTGAEANGVQSGAPGAGVSMQIMKVTGTPAINNNGTTGSQTTRWATFNPNDSRTDDYITGETYTHVAHFAGGILPMTIGANTYLTFDFPEASHIFLQPNTTYAFLLMFDEPGPTRGMALANAFFGSYPGGHGLRREGSQDVTTADVTSANSNQMIENTNDTADTALALAHAKFDPILANRLARSPGTIGVPDVDTYRDFVFYIHASPIPEPSTYAALAAIGLGVLALRRRR